MNKTNSYITRLIIYLLLTCATALPALQLEKESVIAPIENSENNHTVQGIGFINWNSSDNIVYFEYPGMIKCRNLTNNTNIWSCPLPITKFKQYTAGGGCLFLITGKGAITVISLATGKTIKHISQKTLLTSIGQSYIIPTELTWVPQIDAIAISMYGDDYGSNTILLNWKTAKLICRIKSDGDISDMSASENGKYITTHSSSRIRIWDISKKLEIFKTGDGKRVAIDVPFISNSAFDGKNTLVYSIDNSWATGTIHIHDTGTNKEIACFNSMNGHLAMDINFNDSIIALSGTSKHLILADFQGRDIAHQTNASNSRIHTVNFSPDGSRIAIGGEAGTLIIFKITTNNAKPEISDKQNIVLPHPLDFD